MCMTLQDFTSISEVGTAINLGYAAFFRLSDITRRDLDWQIRKFQAISPLIGEGNDLASSFKRRLVSARTQIEMADKAVQNSQRGFAIAMVSAAGLNVLFLIHAGLDPRQCEPLVNILMMLSSALVPAPIASLLYWRMTKKRFHAAIASVRELRSSLVEFGRLTSES